MKASIVNHFPMVTSVFIIVSMFVLLWTYSLDLLFPPVHFGPRMGDIVPPVVRAGQQAQLCRDITYERSMAVHITRSLTQQRPDGTSLVIEFGEMNVIRSPGTIPQCRIIQIPEPLPPGNWELHTWVSYQSWPFWRRDVEAPVVRVTVKSDDWPEDGGTPPSVETPYLNSRT